MPERIVLPCGCLRGVLVDLVAGDDQYRLNVVGRPGCLQDVDRAHDVGLEGRDRLTVGAPHDRLGSEVQHDGR
jgi:hypothetical protein